MLCCTFTSSYMTDTFEVSYNVPVLLLLHQVCTYYVHTRYGVVVGSQTMHPQLCRAKQRSAVQCGAVPCPSFCGAGSCGAVHSFEHTAVVVPGMIQVPGLCTCCVLVFLLSLVDCPLSVPMSPRSPQISHVLPFRTCCITRAVSDVLYQTCCITRAAL